jgi:hypothetical protein
MSRTSASLSAETVTTRLLLRGLLVTRFLSSKVLLEVLLVLSSAALSVTRTLLGRLLLP